MVTLVDGVLASGVVMIFVIDIASYAIQGMEILSLMIQLRILSIILSIFHTHPHNPNMFHTLGILELFRKLHNDVQNIHEELAEYINTPNWNRPTVYYDDDDYEDYTIAITPVLSTKEPDNSLSMGDEHLDTVRQQNRTK
ncbi:hypothetical protein Tco_1025638 [Tanacetum coccineum]